METGRIVIEKCCPNCGRRFAPEDHLVTCSQDGTALLPVTNDGLAGKIVDGKFQLQAVIGTGGCSVVYRATHLALDRVVAFKILRSDLVSTVERIKRFEQEAHMASNLNHPNICTIYDCGMLATGQPYLVMEIVEGKTLADLMLAGRIMPTARAMSLIKQIAAGLSAAHSQGVLHRDLKPGNIMLLDTATGEQVKIIDFGLAKALGTDASELTTSGHAIGTPAYMSPEQVKGDPLEACSDIYSFGCVIYEMLTGRRAVEGRTAFETMQNHLHGNPAPLTSGEYVVPFKLREITLKCLQKDPAERYQFMSELESAIAHAEASGEFQSQMNESVPAPVHRSRAKWIVAAVTGGVVLGLLVCKMIPGAHVAQAPISNADSPITSAGTSGSAIINKESIDPAIAKLLEEFRSLQGTGQHLAANRVINRAHDLVLKEGKQYSPEMVLVGKAMQSFLAVGNRRTESAPYIKAVIEAQQKLLPPLSDELLQAHKDAGQSFALAGEEQQARAQFDQAQKLAKDKYGPESKQYYECLYDEAKSELRSGEFALADAHLKQLLQSKGVYARTDGFRLPISMDLCKVYLSEKKLSEAQAIADEAVAGITSKTDPELQVKVLRNAAHAAERQRDYKKAVALITRAMEPSRAVSGGKDAFWMTNELLAHKGSYLLQAKQYSEAEATLKDALHKLEKTHKPATDMYAWAIAEYVKTLRAQGKNAEADSVQKAGRI